MPTDRVQHHSQQIPSRPHDHVTHRPMGTLPLPAANAATGFIPASATPVTSHCTRYGALHPLPGAAPVTRRCTRSEEVQCPRIRCSTTPNKYLHGYTIASHTVRWAHCHCRQPTQQPASSRQALHPLRRTAPVTGHYTRYQALHPLRGAAPDQKRCNARGSGAAPLPTNTFTAIRSRHTPSDGHTATAGSRRSNRLHPGKHCTRYGALHPLRGATPDQKGCNADGSGAALTTTSTFACAHYPPHSTSAHLSPPPWTPAAVGLTITL